MQYANRECNAIVTISKCTNTAASSNDSNHHSSMPAAWFASGIAYHRQRYRNLRRWTSWRSYAIVGTFPKWPFFLTFPPLHFVVCQLQS